MKDCGCGKSKSADENYNLTKSLAQKYSNKNNEWVVLFLLDCGNWDFSIIDKFNETGKRNIEYIIPMY